MKLYIGILRGSENTFPEALMRYINETVGENRLGEINIVAEDVKVGHHQPSRLSENELPKNELPENELRKYVLLFDRIAHQIPYFRSLLRSVSEQHTYLLNQAVILQNFDRFNCLHYASSLGISVPEMVLLPHHQAPNALAPGNFRNLIYPLDWHKIFSHVHFPALLKTVDEGPYLSNWVQDAEAFFEAYHQSGSRLLVLQQAFAPTMYYRVYVLGQEQFYVMPYNPEATPLLRYHKTSEKRIQPETKERIIACLHPLIAKLRSDFVQVEVALSHGQPYVTDIMFSAVDADYNVVGKVHFEWIVKNLAQLMINKVHSLSAPTVTANSQT